MKRSNILSRAGALAPALLFAGVLLSCAHAQPERLQDATAGSGALAPVAARFVETRREPDHPVESHDWYFVRTDARIETAQGDYAEIWERDGRQDVTWKRVFHGDRKVVEYTTGQLRAERRLKDWSTLATILDQRAIASLELRGNTAALKQRAQRYRGRWGDQQVEVVWLTQQALPARIVRSNRGGTYTLELKDLREAPAFSWPSVNYAQIESYEFIDGADLGDREYDPFVRKVLAMDGGGQGGHSHAH